MLYLGTYSQESNARFSPHKDHPADRECVAGSIPYENFRMTLSVRNQPPLLPALASQTLSNPAETRTTQTVLNPRATEPSPTSAGDKKLVEAYIAAVQKKILHNDPGLVKVPADSQLGQWLELYRSHLQNPVVKQWMLDQGIQISTASIIPSTGVLTFGEGDSKKTFSLTDNSGWGQIAGPILDAAKIISPVLGQRLRVDINGDEVVVRPKLVSDFYGETLPTSRSKASAQIKQLEQNGHAFHPIPANDPLRTTSSRSAEALATQTQNAARFYLAAPQTLAYKRLAVDVAENLPNTRAEAKKWADAILFKLTGKHIDSDTVYLNRFNGGGHTPDPENATITGWEYTTWEPVSSLRLPDALLKNFSENDWVPGNLDWASGLYTDGFGQSKKKGWGAHNQVPILPSQIMHESWKTDFQGEMTKKIDSFWNTHTDQYRTAIKGEFTYQARKQLKTAQAMQPAERALQAPEHRFTREDYRLVMGAVPNLPLDENAPLTIDQLKAQAPLEGQVHALNIAGFASTDILRFSAADGGRQVLYIPGAEPAFLRFDSLEKLEQWVIDQTKDDKKRAALASHFPLIARQDHEPGTLKTIAKVLMPVLWFTDVGSRKEGLDTALQKLASGKLHPAIHDNQSPIAGDVFSAMATATKHRMTSDADVVIKSNSEVTRDTWLNDITVAAGLLAKLAPIAAPVAIAAVATGLTELALGAEKQASGDTAAERRDGASKAFDGLLNTLFSVGASAKPEDPFALAPEKQLPPVEPRPQAEVIVNEEPQPGPSSGIRTDKAPTPKPMPRSPSLIPMAKYAVTDGEQLIKNATPDALGVYRISDRQFVRLTDETGTSKIFEISSRYRAGDNFARIIDPNTRAMQMVVTPGRDGEWARAPGDGGKWWSRTPSPTPSNEAETVTRFTQRFVESDGSSIAGAEKFDDYLNLNQDKEYVFSSRFYTEGGTVKRKLTTSWTVDDGDFSVLEGEKAQHSPFSKSEYSTSFAPDLNRENYSVVTKRPEGDIKTELNYRSNDAEDTIKNRLAKFETAIPDPALRARISEVAHQGSSFPALAELGPPLLKEGNSVKAGDKFFTVMYDPKGEVHTVTAVTHWTLRMEIGDELVSTRDLDITSTRTFKIRASNELDGDGFTIDKSAPTKIEISTLATV